jgi:hypothetical protein
MSLKAFHILFVTVSTLLAVWFTVWCFEHFHAGAGSLYLGLGVGGALLVVGLPIYGVWFLKKMKDVRSP